MNILSAEQIRNWDQFTISKQKITSIELMKRASKAYSEFLISKIDSVDTPVTIVCGNGNNGGDGLGVAINLRDAFFNVKVILLGEGEPSTDNLEMLEEVEEKRNIQIVHCPTPQKLYDINLPGITIDAIFGTGINRPVEGIWRDFIQYINEKADVIFSIDMPSGVPADALPKGAHILSDWCGTFQIPKLSLLIPESDKYAPEWDIIDIGLDPSFEPQGCKRSYLTSDFVTTLLPSRKKFSHKGDYGTTLHICGSPGMSGAAVLSAMSAFRCGAGKVINYASSAVNNIFHNSVIEAMTVDSTHININEVLEQFNPDVILAGPGLGQAQKSAALILSLLESGLPTLVLDADSLNVLAAESMADSIPEGAILTPHVKEFSRLFGSCTDHIERLNKASEKARKYNIYILLKGAHSCICAPDGMQYFNATGNPGLASSGTGDVLAGMISGFIAQGIDPLHALQLSVYLHGLSADLAKEKFGTHAMIATDVIQYIPEAIKKIYG